VHVHHSNPLCGDEMDLRIRVDDGLLDAVVFDGEGCSISQASASAMTVAVTGRRSTTCWNSPRTSAR
jgi:nitrogen fixation protein NifU and related proteins